MGTETASGPVDGHLLQRRLVDALCGGRLIHRRDGRPLRPDEFELAGRGWDIEPAVGTARGETTLVALRPGPGDARWGRIVLMAGPLAQARADRLAHACAAEIVEVANTAAEMCRAELLPPVPGRTGSLQSTLTGARGLR